MASKICPTILVALAFLTFMSEGIALRHAPPHVDPPPARVVLYGIPDDGSRTLSLTLKLI
jgi:hypothetical protein